MRVAREASPKIAMKMLPVRYASCRATCWRTPGCWKWNTRQRVTRGPADLDGSGIANSFGIFRIPNVSPFPVFPPDPVHAPWSRHRLCARGANTNRSGASQTYDPLSPHRIDNRPHVIWIMVHAPNSTLHAPINSKTQLSLRRRGCCACGVRARTSFPRMTDGKYGGLGESVS